MLAKPPNSPTKNSTSNQSINYVLSQRNKKIEELTLEKKKYIQLIYGLQSELYSLKNRVVIINKLESEKKIYQNKNSTLEIELEKLKKEILELNRKYNEEKRQSEVTHNEEMRTLKLENENLKSKVGVVNDHIKEKNGLMKAFNILLEEKKNILSQHDKDMRQNEIKNQIKLNKLKKKMLDSVNKTQLKANELNVEYMDVSTKLTILQNHQFMVQLEYQEQQLNKLMAKNELLEKKIFEFKKDIEIHKEVELSLAEKNKKLIEEVQKFKDGEKTENEKVTQKAQLISSNSALNFGINVSEKNNLNNKVIQLEKKVLNLEKKLQIKQKEYYDLKDRSDSFEKILKNYEKRYMGLFNYFEECLKLFFNDEELKNNKNIFINIDSMQKGDFSNLNVNEKYSTLIILMKYLMPLIYNNESVNNYNSINNVNIKFYSSRKIRFPNTNRDNIKNNNSINSNIFKNIMSKKQSRIINGEGSVPSNLNYNSFDDLPNIGKNSSLLSPRKLSINLKQP